MPDAPERQEKLYTGQLRRDIQLFPGQHDEDGMPTWVLFDPVSDKYFRLQEREYLMISLLYENRLVDDFYDRSISLGSTIDRNGVFNVISFLMSNNLMMPVYGSTESRLLLQREAVERGFWTRVLYSYLFFKIPLFSPDAFISRSAPFVLGVFNKWTLLLLALISGAGYLSVMANWSRLLEAVVASMTLSGLVKYSVAIVAMKVFHELCHAYVAKSFGVRVRRFGIGIMVFFPRLYTDITDSWRITDRKARAMIDAAGIVFELLAGGFAALLWLNSPPSAFATICYYVFTVTAVNTLLVNGNPFIKYDGYYLLMDLVNIDNLQQRSFQAVNALFLKWLFGIKRSSRPILRDPVKNAFLTFFGVASFLYRIFLYTSIILIIYFKFAKALGIALILLEIYILCVRPVLNQIRIVMAYKSKIKAFNAISTSVAALLLAIAFLAPMPWRLSLPCEVKSDGGHVLYAPFDGFLTELPLPEGAKVSKGQRVATLSSPEMELDLKRKEADLKMAMIEYDRLSSSKESVPQAGPVLKRAEMISNDIDELRRRLALFEIKAESPGELCYYDSNLKASKWLKRGEAFGELFDPGAAVVLAYAKESELGRLKQGDAVSVSLKGELSEIKGVIKSVNKVPERTPLPSPLLSPSGGPIKVKDSPQGAVYEEPVYQVSIEPLDRSALREGRTGDAFVRKPQSIAMSVVEQGSIWLRKLLSF